MVLAGVKLRIGTILELNRHGFRRVFCARPLGGAKLAEAMNLLWRIGLLFAVTMAVWITRSRVKRGPGIKE